MSAQSFPFGAPGYKNFHVSSDTLPGICIVWGSLGTDIHKRHSWACSHCNLLLPMLTPVLLLGFYLLLFLWLPSSWLWLWWTRWRARTWWGSWSRWCGGRGWGWRDRWGRWCGWRGWARRRWGRLIDLHFTLQTLLGLWEYWSCRRFWAFLWCVGQIFFLGEGLLLDRDFDIILKFKELAVVLS